MADRPVRVTREMVDKTVQERAFKQIQPIISKVAWEGHQLAEDRKKIAEFEKLLEETDSKKE